MAGTNGDRVQAVMHHATRLFKRVGLHMNYAKSKMMIGKVGHLWTHMCPSAYHRRITGEGDSYKHKMVEIVECTIPGCEKTMTRRRLKDHLLLKHQISSGLSIHRPPLPVQHLYWEMGDYCPVVGCEYAPQTSFAIRRHMAFVHTNVELTMPHINLHRCTSCKMFSPQPDLCPRPTPNPYCANN